MMNIAKVMSVTTCLTITNFIYVFPKYQIYEKYFMSGNALKRPLQALNKELEEFHVFEKQNLNIPKNLRMD